MAEPLRPEGLGPSEPKRGRYRSKHERLVLTSTWSHDERELSAAMALVRQSGVLGPLETVMKMPPAPGSRLSVFGYLVALTLNGSTLHHKATLVDIVRLLNGFGPGALDRLGMRAWRRVGAYDHVHRFHKRLAALLDAAPEVLDADTGELVTCDWAWFKRRLLLAAIPDEVMATMAGKTDLAIDGIEMESCGRLCGEPSEIDYDGEASPPDDAEKPKEKNAKRKERQRSSHGRHRGPHEVVGEGVAEEGTVDKARRPDPGLLAPLLLLQFREDGDTEALEREVEALGGGLGVPAVHDHAVAEALGLGLGHHLDGGVAAMAPGLDEAGGHDHRRHVGAELHVAHAIGLLDRLDRDGEVQLPPARRDRQLVPPRGRRSDHRHRPGLHPHARQRPPRAVRHLHPRRLQPQPRPPVAARAATA
jgi:hypothetical protein